MVEIASNTFSPGALMWNKCFIEYIKVDLKKR
jgi:hypothetical protein